MPPQSADVSGPMHWVRIDLATPGVGLFVTPTDPDLEPEGYQYRLRRPADVAGAEGLAVVVNGSLFTPEPSLPPGCYWTGQRARGVETVVSDGRVSHLWEHTYLLGVDADMTPHLERQKPPSVDVLARTRWGVGGQGVGLADGVVTNAASGARVTARTAIGVNPNRRLLILAVFESATERRALVELATLGATEGLLLDGGGSTGMVIGAGAVGVRPGVVLGGRRPVATHLGVRADRLPP